MIVNLNSDVEGGWVMCWGKQESMKEKREIKMRGLPQTGDRGGKDGSPAPFHRQSIGRGVCG